MKKQISACLATLVLWSTSLIVSATSEAAGVPQTLDVTVGSQQVVAGGHTLRRIAIGDPTVADVLIVKGDKTGGVLLIGKSPGSTNLMLWERGTDVPLAYTVNVTAPASRTLIGPDTPNVKVLGDTALISGSATSMEAHHRAVAAAEIEAGQRASKGGAGGGGKGGDGADASGIYDTSTIGTRSVVQVDVRVVEFSRSVLKEVGLNILKQNNGFTFGSFAPSSLTSATLGQAPQFTSTMPISSAFNLVFNSATRGIQADLSLMEANNLARILAEPTLVALSGQSASFLAGGEIPVPSPQGLGTTSIEYKPYGVGLTLTPTVLSPDRIALKIAPEASELDFTNAVTISGVSVPALTTRRADTTVELGDGESFMIGGLIDRETASNVNKVPVLGDLPIIGAFFKQLTYQQTDKELVIIVTPHLVSPIAKGAALPSTPGEQSEQRDAPVWRSFVGGVLSPDAAPGFSK
ncbi:MULTISPECIES: type II and III secretion system protein family protein [Paraburkholderia]|uniref:type II and III secretion system protein family protein n=1 Tax=Paraburkholderia TaxID=1822464 RepID=UPI00225BB287|nr:MULTISPECIES: type II and III secretion system protein family protein [Paraburkholderia]MCX4164440.1 type II and III secretion system protein family protein [Paraburkholderia megapolitana]MDN7159933.1 type II and III secretion system protein family protein [Paraburkholderia sp. CHISQ3]MDQ6496980.1 type II and III secretion system protein family protein [Paraburkholderia megapolitana]